MCEQLFQDREDAGASKVCRRRGSAPASGGAWAEGLAHLSLPPTERPAAVPGTYGGSLVNTEGHGLAGELSTPHVPSLSHRL